MDAALDRLDWIPADELITHRIPFERAPEAYELLDSAPDDAVQVILGTSESLGVVDARPIRPLTAR